MKQILLFAFFCTLLNTVIAQIISPSQSSEFCPNVEYTFTASIPKTYQSMIGTSSASVTQLPTSPVGSTFTFKGKFGDANQKQSFRVYYTDNTYYDFEFKQIKSLFYSNQISSSCPAIQPNQATVTAPLCKINSISISFAAVKWNTAFENPNYCFGTITSYEYQLPAGWILNSVTSTGSNWIAGTNNVTVTSDFSTGGAIRIRQANNCGSGLANGQIPVQILINRPSGFAVTPANVPISCGSTTSITFTVNNINNVTGISDHLWNLGATPNGWLLPNGNPAPATYSTGTINTLTLTPVCGSTQNNVGATVTVNGVNCAASSSSVSNIQANLSIDGSTNFCSNANYFVDKLPCNTTSIVWELMPSNAGTLTVTGNQVAVTPAWGAGNVTLKATVNSACFSSAVQVQKQIIFGVPDHMIDVLEYQGIEPQTVFYSNSSYSFGARATEPYPYPPYYLETPYLSAATASYIWKIIKYDAYGGSVQYNLGTYSYGINPDFYFEQAGEYDIVLDIINSSCSYHIRYFTRRITVQNLYGRFSISPNPSSGNIKIQPPVGATGKKQLKPLEIHQVEVIDKMGNVKHIQSFATGSITVNLSLSHLPNDIYTLRIFDGKNWHSHKMVMQH